MSRVGRGAHSEPILDREALAEERARLVARLVEIDVLLRYRVGYRAWAARPLAEERARLVARLAEIDAPQGSRLDGGPRERRGRRDSKERTQ